MRYAAARDQIQSGDLIAIRSRHGGLPAVIRWVTGSPYTHTAIAIWAEGRLLIAETTGAGSCLRPLSTYAGNDFDVISCPIDRVLVRMAVWDILGVKADYDLADLLRIAANRLFGRPLPSADDEAQICSALSAAIWQLAGWRPAGLPSIPAPDDLVRAAGAVWIEVRNA